MQAAVSKNGRALASHIWSPMGQKCGECGWNVVWNHRHECRNCGTSLEIREIVWNESPRRVATRCEVCRGVGHFRLERTERQDCAHVTKECRACSGIGWLGIDPLLPVDLSQGKPEKVIVLAARYAAGLSLFNPRDRCDLMGRGSTPSVSRSGWKFSFDVDRFASEDI